MATDKRIIKTEQKLETTFIKLLTEKKLEQITVTELVTDAGINKGTFYLHYPDLYALFDDKLHKLAESITGGITDYNAFFDDPAGFMEQYIASRGQQRKLAVALLSATESRPIFRYLTEMMMTRIYQLNRLEKQRYNDIMLESTLYGVNFILIKYYHSDRQQALKAATAMVANASLTLQFAADR